MNRWIMNIDMDAEPYGPVTKRRINKSNGVGYTGIDMFDCKFGDLIGTEYNIRFGVDKESSYLGKKRHKIENRKWEINGGSR